MKSRNTLDIVIVNWNSGEYLKKCLSSISKYSDELVGKVLVVDNGSSDGSELSAAQFKFVTLIKSKNNLGFARACNLGVLQSTSEFILFLNPDAELFSGTLKASLVFMQHPQSQHFGICGVQLINEEGEIARHCSRYPTFRRMLAHSLGFSRIFPKLGYVLSDWEHNKTAEVDHVIGAYFLVRRKLFEQINGFDERFFVYLEDMDFSYRASKAGWKSVYLADVQAFHVGGGCSAQVKAKRLCYSLRSRLFYGFKHFSRWKAWVLVFVTCVLEPCVRIIRHILRFDWSGVKEVFRGYKYFYKKIRSDFREHWYRVTD